MVYNAQPDPKHVLHRVLVNPKFTESSHFTIHCNGGALALGFQKGGLRL
jgi:hypothetical protein